jgi:hypothetical protein
LSGRPLADGRDSVGGDRRGVGEQRRPLQDVRELTHVAGPRVPEQACARVGGERERGQLVVGSDAAEEVFGEEKDVVAALAQRRQTQRHDREPVIEVLAELVLSRRRREVFVARADHPDVDGLAASASESADRAVFDGLEELALHRVP